jgi:hypothetical protein
MNIIETKVYKLKETFVLPTLKVLMDFQIAN